MVFFLVPRALPEKGQLPNSSLAMPCGMNVWFVGPHLDNDFVVSIQNPNAKGGTSPEDARLPLVVDDAGTCRVLVPEQRGTVEVSSMRLHVVPKLSDVDGLWKGEVCQPLEGDALCLGKLFRSRPLDGCS